jgi:TPP-dependent pyruvate/acetoin dehydrogenase alpha subunit
MANHPLPAPDVAREWLQTMMLIRRFEERAGEMYAKAKVGGFLHLAIGEEATIVGSARAMRDDDYLISTYRSHGHALVRGTSPEGVMAELFGRVDGVSKGRGGSMHMFDLERRFMGGYGIVGGNLPIAAGFGLASDYLGTEDATLCTFGDAVDSAFQKSGSCKCSERARSCNPLYPSLCSRSSTFHHRYRYPPPLRGVSDCLLDIAHS